MLSRIYTDKNDTAVQIYLFILLLFILTDREALHLDGKI